MEIKFKFYNKLHLILEKLCDGDYDKLTDYFLDEKKTGHENRKKHIKKMIRDTVYTYSKDFKENYINYKISSIFTLDEFIESSENEFRDIIEEYLTLKEKRDYSVLYPYMYIFNRGSRDKIYCYKIECISKEKNRVQKIKMESTGVHESYTGDMIYHTNGSISFIVKNNISTIHVLIQNDLDTPSFKYLYGIALGMADKNQKILIAKKVVLSKEKIDDNEYKDIYLSLNETEIISTVESFHHTDKRKDIFTHLEKYSIKLNDYNNLFMNLTKNHNLKSDFYLQLAFKEFYGLSKLIEKVSLEKQYFTLNRTNLLESVFEVLDTLTDTVLYMVMPIFESNNIFIKETTKSNQLRERFLKLKKSNIIFVIDLETDLRSFQFVLEEIIKFNNIKFVLKEEIANSVNSLDFLYTDKKDFIATKRLRTDKEAFYISKERDTIEEHEIFYKKIDKMSISYIEFNKTPLSFFPKNINNILGRWYFYHYGAYIDKNISKRKLWKSVLEINHNRVVRSLRKDGKELIGDGELIIGKKQIIIHIISNNTHKSKIIYFDKSEKAYPMIQVLYIDKQFASELDMLSVGVICRKELSDNEIRDILGSNGEELIFKPPLKLQDKINKFNLLNSSYYDI